MASDELEDRVQRLQWEVDSMILKIPLLEKANASLLQKFASLEAKYHNHMRHCVGPAADVPDPDTTNEIANNGNDGALSVSSGSTGQPPACTNGQFFSHRDMQHSTDHNKELNPPVGPTSNLNFAKIDSPSDLTTLFMKSEDVQDTAIHSKSTDSAAADDLHMSGEMTDSKVLSNIEPKIEAKAEQLCSEHLGQESQVADVSHSPTPSPLRDSVRPNLRLRVEVVLPPVPRHWKSQGSKRRIWNRNASSHAPPTEVGEPRPLGSGQHINDDTGNGKPERRDILAFLPVADSMSELADSDLLDRSEDNDEDSNMIVDITKQCKTGDDMRNLPTTSLFGRTAVAGIVPLEINVPTELLDATITRKFLSNICGGRMQSTFSEPHQNREYGEKSSVKTFVRLMQEFNGYAPQKPGMPGLFFGNSRYHVWPVSQEQVFTRLRSGDWLYQGDYEFIRCQSMTCAEYLLQTDGFRTTWSSKCKSAKWATYIRATIALRQELLREPTGIEVDARIAAIAADRSTDKITTSEIDTAFACGEEVIGIWAMKCIGYDESFKRAMIEQFNSWARLNEPDSIRREPGRQSDTRRSKVQADPCLNSKIGRLRRMAPAGASGGSRYIDA